MLGDHSITIASAADSRYFYLLRDLVRSLKAGSRAPNVPLSIFDVGLEPEERRWLESAGASVAEPRWDFEFPGRDHIPAYFRATVARPSLPRYFPGYEVYFWLDADTWVQDDAVLPLFVQTALRGKLAIVPEIDRGYWVVHKRSRLWGQNEKSFAWAYGLRAGYRYGRHPILNSGVFALHRDAPHWQLWASALRRALTRRRWTHGSRLWNFYYSLAEQTALNHVVFADKAPAGLLPACCNWFCNKGVPMYDRERRLLVEPQPPHQPLGIVHLAGPTKDRTWRLEILQGGTVETLLTYEAVGALSPAGSLVRGGITVPT